MSQFLLNLIKEHSYTFEYQHPAILSEEQAWERVDVNRYQLTARDLINLDGHHATGEAREVIMFSRIFIYDLSLQSRIE